MIIENLVKENRSFRKFCQEEPVSGDTLKYLVNLGRCSASSANLQPLRYIISHESEMNGKIFSSLAWAGYLKDWPGPEEGKRPTAYIVILGDSDVSKNVISDQGIAAQSILLGAREIGLGGCIIGSFNKKSLAKTLQIPEKYDILLVLALGKPDEDVVIVDTKQGESIKYWRDEEGVHYVPKLRLEDIILDFSE